MAAPETLSRAEVRHRRRVRIWASLAAFVLFAAVAVGAAIVFSGGGGTDAAAPVEPSASAAPLAGSNVASTFAVAPVRAVSQRGIDIPVYEQPVNTGTPVQTLSKLTEYKAPRTLLAFDQYQDWYHVYLPTRPNNSTGWVKATDVNVSKPLEYSIKVNLADHHLWVVRNGVVEFDAPVAIGMPQYPTPTGTYYFTDPVDLHSIPNTAYGVFAMGLSGHSDVLTEFGGGDGQIAIHGTNDPSGIGHDVSHGCVRVNNDIIERLSKLPLGTPVYIT